MSNQNFIVVGYPKIAQCEKCFKLAYPPLRTSCNHLFCVKCGEDISIMCPICNTMCYAPKRDDLILRIIEGLLKVKCIHENCSFVGSISDCYDHLNTCSFEMEKRETEKRAMLKCIHKLDIK